MYNTPRWRLRDRLTRRLTLASKVECYFGRQIKNIYMHNRQPGPKLDFLYTPWALLSLYVGRLFTARRGIGSSSFSSRLGCVYFQTFCATAQCSLAFALNFWSNGPHAKICPSRLGGQTTRESGTSKDESQIHFRVTWIERGSQRVDDLCTTIDDEAICIRISDHARFPALLLSFFPTGEIVFQFSSIRCYLSSVFDH